MEHHCTNPYNIHNCCPLCYAGNRIFHEPYPQRLYPPPWQEDKCLHGHNMNKIHGRSYHKLHSNTFPRKFKSSLDFVDICVTREKEVKLRPNMAKAVLQVFVPSF